MPPTRPIPKRADKTLDDIIDSIAKEEGLTSKRTRIIIQSVFEQIANDIRTENLKGSHILHFGKFLIKPYRLQKYLDKKDGSNS